MIRIIHITAHLGGGVGKILSSIAIHSKEECEFEHIIVTLEPTQTAQFEELCKAHNIKIILAAEHDVDKILQQADIVELDWWHHPLTSQFMVNYLDKIKCRLLIWSHVSGCSYPNISSKFVMSSDAFVFSTPFSYENPFWSEEERKQVTNKSDVVISSGVDFIKPVKKKPHTGFNVGYIGFLGYNKTHPEFVKYCERASDIPDIGFIVVGDKSYGEELIRDVKSSNKIRDKVLFTGYSLNVLENLSEFDVFAYPLNPNHYGTAENVLLEAMAAGVVPVVLNQCTEKYLVKNMETGIVVNNMEEYADALRWLYENPVQRVKLGDNAAKFIKEEYYIKATIKKLNKVYERVLAKEKVIHNTSEFLGETAYEWFLSCYVGDINNIQGNAFSETKGSAKHYLKYFSEDNKLREVVEKNESRNKTKL